MSPLRHTVPTPKVHTHPVFDGMRRWLEMAPEAIGAGVVTERVNHPSHYQRGGVECIDVVEHLSFNRGNAIKYLWRAGIKATADEIEDLEKAAWYVNREIARLRARVEELEAAAQGGRPAS